MIGGNQPIAVQSMTTTPTQDIAATVRQCIALAEAGCEIVRITAQNVKAAEALKEIRQQFSSAGFSSIPLVADIHFLPQAAMEAARWVEKVRINPGNYADKKKFQQREYSGSEYDLELERLHEAFSPIVLRCRDLGRAMRIGTNHGSLSDRIMNRYGDTPLGMCESALEFLRIAESHGFHDIVLSMKASNPKVMIQAYRLMVAKMADENMHYPLHLGVTEAGDGNDARIKSSIGIGSLLYDGLGDTIRVSLTEDPVYEIPVALDLARKAHHLWHRVNAPREAADPVNPYEFTRRDVATIRFGAKRSGILEPPLVIGKIPDLSDLGQIQAKLKDARIEGLIIRVPPDSGQNHIKTLRDQIAKQVEFVIWDFSDFETSRCLSRQWLFPPGDAILVEIQKPENASNLQEIISFAESHQLTLFIASTPAILASLGADLASYPTNHIVFTLTASASDGNCHPLGQYRQLAEVVDAIGISAPIWIRNQSATSIDPKPYFGDQLMEASILSGALLCDGIGDLISVESVEDPVQAVTLAYDILQGARARTTKTEYVACPSCGRTLFDLQTTTQKIRAATGHLKGVTIAVMGCIVNGPGEMADADFGYVGGAPGKVNLYVGKECVRYHIPAAQAVDSLIDLIREHGKWQDPAEDNGIDRKRTPSSNSQSA